MVLHLITWVSNYRYSIFPFPIVCKTYENVFFSRWPEVLRDLFSRNVLLIRLICIWLLCLKIDFRPKLHYPKFTCHFITSNLKLHNSIAKFAKQQLFCLSFSSNVIGLFIKALKYDWLFCFVLLSHSLWLRKRCDLEQKI